MAKAMERGKFRTPTSENNFTDVDKRETYNYEGTGDLLTIVAAVLC